MVLQPDRVACKTISSGDVIRPGMRGARPGILDSEWFWHQGHLRLHPAVATERLSVPGRKWKRGFFSMGSVARLVSMPWLRLTSVPPRFSLTLQMPLLPGLTVQRWAQSLQRTDPPPSGSWNIASRGKPSLMECGITDRTSTRKVCYCDGPMRAWKTRRGVVSLVESGWARAPIPVRRVMGMVEGVASRMHGAIGAARSTRFIELPRDVRVLSVGAVSWGGDGKTPLAGYMARQLSKRGMRVAVVTRSMGTRITSATRVPSGPLLDRREDVSSWGDEAVMLAAGLTDVPVWSGPDRGASILACLVDRPRAIVLDDGLSLRGVRKDLEIALLSCGQSCFRRIPAGPLRRPVTDTSRADIVGIQVGEAVADLEAEARRLLELSRASTRPWFGFRLEPVCTASTGPVHLAAGIARPERFEAAARGAGYEVAGTTWFPDHHVPDDSDLAELARRAGDSLARGVLVTAKDAPRFPAVVGTLPVQVLEVQLRVLAHEHVLLEAIDGTLRQAERG